MKKKTVLMIACIASLILVFAGCSSSNFAIVVNEDLNIEITAENADKDMTGSTGTFTVGEGDDVQIGDLLDDLLQRVRTGDLLLLDLPGLLPLGQLIGDRPAKFLVAGVADVIAKTHDGGGGGEGVLGQRVNTQVHHQLWIVQDDPGDFFFRAGEIVRAFPQPQQRIAHRTHLFICSPVFLLFLFLILNYSRNFCQSQD